MVYGDDGQKSGSTTPPPSNTGTLSVADPFAIIERLNHRLEQVKVELRHTRDDKDRWQGLAEARELELEQLKLLQPASVPERAESSETAQPHHGRRRTPRKRNSTNGGYFRSMYKAYGLNVFALDAGSTYSQFGWSDAQHMNQAFSSETTRVVPYVRRVAWGQYQFIAENIPPEWREPKDEAK